MRVISASVTLWDRGTMTTIRREWVPEPWCNVGEDSATYCAGATFSKISDRKGRIVTDVPWIRDGSFNMGVIMSAFSEGGTKTRVKLIIDVVSGGTAGRHACRKRIKVTGGRMWLSDIRYFRLCWKFNFIINTGPIKLSASHVMWLRRVTRPLDIIPSELISLSLFWVLFQSISRSVTDSVSGRFFTSIL